MNTKLNLKQWAIATVAVFVLMTLIAFLLIRLGVAPWAPSATATPTVDTTTQPDPMAGRIVVYLSRLLLAGLFAFIFTKWADGKSGTGAGISYGFWVGLLMYVPFFLTFGLYSGEMGSQVLFIIVGIIQSMISGAIVAQIYKPSTT